MHPDGATTKVLRAFFGAEGRLEQIPAKRAKRWRTGGTFEV